MRNLASLALMFAFFGGGAWVIFGTNPAAFWLRGLIYAAIIVTLGLVAAIIASIERAVRHSRNAQMARQQGFSYRDDANVSEFIPAESVFDRQSTIESVMEGERKGARFALFDLTYTVQVSNSEGGSTTNLIEQTVVVLPGQAAAKCSLTLLPIGIMERKLLSFLGLLGSAEANPQNDADRELVEWLDQHYQLSSPDDQTRLRAEQLLQMDVLRWLREHEGIAFEWIGETLLVWRPCQIVSAEDRQSLLDGALDLAALLAAADRGAAIRKPLAEPAIQFRPAPVGSLEGVFWRLALSGFASWVIACVVGISFFFVGFATGWMQAAPSYFLVAMMSVTIFIWIGSGIAIHYWLVHSSKD